MIWALHGAMGAASDWAELQGMGMNLRVVRLWEGVESFEHWALRFTARVREEDPAPSILGYSMGGRLALHALAAAPGLWRSAVFVSTHPGLASEEECAMRREADAVWARRVRKERIEEVLEAWENQAIFEGSKRDFDRDELEAKREAVARSFTAWSLGRQGFFEEMVAGVKCPSIWIAGERDGKFCELAERAAAAVGGDAKHCAMAGCGHRVPWEDPVGFAREVLRWQNEVAMG